MKQIRYGVFETNSSSTHSLTICSDEEYKKFESGVLVWDEWRNEFVPLDSSQDQDDCSTHDAFFNDNDLETFHETYTTKGGEVIHAFGKYGYDG